MCGELRYGSCILKSGIDSRLIDQDNLNLRKLMEELVIKGRQVSVYKRITELNTRVSDLKSTDAPAVGVLLCATG